ncbi:MAG TPA: choice-of-anchor Q domain-containing protein [Lacipirellulaceae bacterium]
MTVNTELDTVEFDDNVTSLREAIFATNLVAGPDTINFDFGHDGPATILLTQGELAITDHLAIDGPGAELLTIDASGNDPTPDLNNADDSRVFNIDDGQDESRIDVSINGVRLTGGDAAGNGGAIAAVENLNLSDVVVERNAAVAGFSSGGGVYATAPLVIENSRVVDNSLTAGLSTRGGGVAALAGLTIRNSEISGNVAGRGGIYARSFQTSAFPAATRILDSTISNNAGGGAIVESFNGPVEILRTTVFNNMSAMGLQLTLRNGATALIGESTFSGHTGGSGLGLMTSNSGAATIRGSNFIGNVARNNDGGGAAIFGSTGSVTIDGCSFVENAARSGGGLFAFGNVQISNSIFRRNVANGFGQSMGGGIFLNAEVGNSTPAVIRNSVFEENIASSTTPFRGHGGGIFSRARFDLIESTVTGNSANGSGGGIYAVVFGSTIASSNIHGNSAGQDGGGIAAKASSRAIGLSVTDTMIGMNIAGRDGGGLFADADPVAISGSTILENSAAVNGGGLRLHVDSMVTNSTLSGNSAGARGGGVWAISNTTLDHSTITENQAVVAGGGAFSNVGSLALSHTIVASNTAPQGPDLHRGPNGPITADYSLIGDSEDSGLHSGSIETPDANGNLVGGGNFEHINPMLGPLADNGGPTLTHALLLGSPAINAGNLNAQPGAEGVPQFDQRGEPFARIVGGRIDIGAFEFQEASDLNLLVDTLSDELDDNHGRGDLSLREAIELANLYPSDDTIRFDPTLFTNGEATILLTLGHLHVKGNAAIEGPGAELLTIDASGNDPTPGVNNGDGSRVFTIEPAPPLGSFHSSLAGMTITGGDVEGTGGGIRTFTELTLRDVAITNNSAFSNAGGGGISVRDRRLTVISSRITGNSAMGRNDYGGGILGINASISIVGSQISENMARYGGGVAVLLSHMLSIENSTVENNESIHDGGGIFSRGPVTINASVIRNNRGENGGGLYVQPGGSTSSNSEISNSSIIGNQATRDGGGAYLVTVNLLNTTFSSNVAGAAGGGLYALNLPTMGTHAFIKDSRFIENRAGTSGGAIRTAANLRIIQSTISGNTADAHGGGIAVYHFSNNDNVLTENTTITGNGANQNGGGVFIQAPNDITVALTFSTITSNFSNFDSVAGGTGGGIFVARGRARLDHTIVAANRDRSSIAPDITGFIGTVLEPRYSLIGTNVGSGLAATPIDHPDENGNLIGGSTPINPRLGPLADNGGPTRTHALLPDSSALNAGDPAARAGVDGVPLGDQRGAQFTRVYGGRIDIGAFECQPIEFLLGDFNRNKTVDAADLILWRKANGRSDDFASYVDAHGNGDGVVDQSDYALWRANYGKSHACSARYLRFPILTCAMRFDSAC